MAAVAYLGMLGLWRYTRLGKKLEAISEDAMGAQTIGISMRRASQIACLVAARWRLRPGSWRRRSSRCIRAWASTSCSADLSRVAIGGFGSLSGSVVGGMFVGFASQAVAVYLGPTWVNTMLFTGLLLVFLVRPQGLFGRAQVRVV